MSSDMSIGSKIHLLIDRLTGLQTAKFIASCKQVGAIYMKDAINAIRAADAFFNAFGDESAHYAAFRAAEYAKLVSTATYESERARQLKWLETELNIVPNRELTESLLLSVTSDKQLEFINLCSNKIAAFSANPERLDRAKKHVKEAGVNYNCACYIANAALCAAANSTDDVSAATSAYNAEEQRQINWLKGP